jgi:pyrroline-5-carboxylate reductase
MKQTVGIIGGGNMGSAIIAGIRYKFPVFVCEKDKARQKILVKKFRLKTHELSEVIKQSSILILAVKPQDFDGILKECEGLITKKHLVISIAAGITCQYIEKRLGADVRVIRTMPNLPAQIGQGVTAVSRGKMATVADQKKAQKIFDSVGVTVLLEEKWINGITAVSGSGPAYLFYFVECFENAARALGFDAKQSRSLVNQTIRGSLNLLEASKEDAAALRERVTSKGGTTQAALNVLTSKNTENIFKDALKAAEKRARELSK